VRKELAYPWLRRDDHQKSYYYLPNILFSTCTHLSTTDKTTQHRGDRGPDDGVPRTGTCQLSHWTSSVHSGSPLPLTARTQGPDQRRRETGQNNRKQTIGNRCTTSAGAVISCLIPSTWHHSNLLTVISVGVLVFYHNAICCQAPII
jgi:hypothetical protein